MLAPRDRAGGEEVRRRLEPEQRVGEGLAGEVRARPPAGRRRGAPAAGRSPRRSRRPSPSRRRTTRRRTGRPAFSFSTRAARAVSPKACFHCSWSYVRANPFVSTSAEMFRNHSGKYSCLVASRVNSAWRHRVAGEDHRGHAGRLHPGDGVGGRLLQRGRVQRVRDVLPISTPGVLVGVDRVLPRSRADGGVVGLDVQVGERPLLLLELGIAGELGRCGPPPAWRAPRRCAPLACSLSRPRPMPYGARSSSSSWLPRAHADAGDAPRRELLDEGLVRIGPPKTMKGLMSSAIFTASARAVVASVAPPWLW